MSEVTMEQAATMIDANDRGEEVKVPEVPAEQPQDAQPTQQAPQGFDEAKMRTMLEEMLNQQLSRSINPLKSELGKFRQTQSEFDKIKNQLNQTPVPKTWQELDPQSQQATDELLKHRLEALFGDKFKQIDEIAAWRQEQVEQSERVQASVDTENILRQVSGDKFSEVEPIAAKIFAAAQEAKQNGDESASRFIAELYATESGKFRLAQMAMAEYSKSIEAKADKAKAEQSDKAKRASTAVGGAQPPVSSQAPKRGSKEWMEAAKQALDQAYSQG